MIMHIRYCHTILALVAAALMFAGCSKRLTPEAGDGEIDFSAAAVRMEERTKNGGTLDERTSFEVGDVIKVSAWHRQNSEKIFDNEPVTKTAADPWSYAPKKKWRWSDSDYYDFFAVPDGVTATSNNAEPFSLSVSYDATASQYDLLMAGTRHKISDSNPSRIVDLDFQHMLSAVKVIFYKYTGGEAVVIKSFHFTDLVVKADVEGYWDDGDKRFDSRLTNTLRLASEQFGESREKPWLIEGNYLTNTSNPYDPGFFDLLPPQDLDPGSGAPSLVVQFADHVNTNPDPEGEFTPTVYSPAPILLKNIPVEGSSSQFITRWEPGHKYIYKVYILFDGGVLVNVVTTKWDEVSAQTPGLMI